MWNLIFKYFPNTYSFLESMGYANFTASVYYHYLLDEDTIKVPNDELDFLRSPEELTDLPDV